MEFALLYAKSSHDQMAKCWRSFCVPVCAFFLCNDGRKEGFGLWFWCLLPRWSPGLVSWIMIHGVHAAAVQQIFQLSSAICCCESFSLHLIHFGISVHVKMSMNGAFLCSFTSVEFLFSLVSRFIFALDCQSHTTWSARSASSSLWGEETASYNKRVQSFALFE
jgi:hypothetical protein